MDKIIVAATQNKHKIVEIEAITKEFGMSVISRKDAGVPDVEIVEDGSTFEENSYKKAYEIMKLCVKVGCRFKPACEFIERFGNDRVYNSVRIGYRLA